MCLLVPNICEFCLPTNLSSFCISASLFSIGYSRCGSAFQSWFQSLCWVHYSSGETKLGTVCKYCESKRQRMGAVNATAKKNQTIPVHWGFTKWGLGRHLKVWQFYGVDQNQNKLHHGSKLERNVVGRDRDHGYFEGATLKRLTKQRGEFRILSHQQ